METHIFGDSNIVRFLPQLKETKSDPSIQSVSVTKATNAVSLRDALSNPTTAYPLIIVAALTNLVTAKYFEDYDLMIDHCKTVFNDVMLWIQEGRDCLEGFAAQVIWSTVVYFAEVPCWLCVLVTVRCVAGAYLYSLVENYA